METGQPASSGEVQYSLSAWESMYKSLDEITFAVVDTETTGLRPGPDRVIELAVVCVRGGEVIDTFQSLVNPCCRISPFIINFTGITPEMLSGAPAAKEIMPHFLQCIDGTLLVGHNLSFDLKFLSHEAQLLGRTFPLDGFDTIPLARRFLPGLKRFKLDMVAAYLQIPASNRHRALGDAEITAAVFLHLLERARQQGISTLAHLRCRLQLPVAWSGDITQVASSGKGTATSRGKRAAIYTRSFQAKVLRDKPLEIEVERCKAYCARWGYSIDENQIYYEIQTDGDEQDQPELYHLLAAAKRGCIDVVVITGPGRLSSSPAELVTIIQQFQNVGVKVETTEPSFLDRAKSTECDQMKSGVQYRQKKRSKWTEYEIVGAPTIQQQNGLRRVAIYAKGDTNSLQEQIEHCKAYCARNGYRIDKDQLYFEVREGTDEQDRPELNPELNRLTEVAKGGLIDVIVLTNVQMFTRRPSYLAVILQVFQDAGVSIETID